MGDTNFKFSTIQSDKNIIQYRNTLLAIFKEKTDGLTSPTKSQLQTILFKAIEQHINVARREWFNKIKSNISDKSYKLDNNNNFMSWNDARPIADGGEYSSVRVFLDKYRNHGSSDIAFENNADFTNVDVTAEGVNTFNYLGTFVNLEFILESLFIECVDNDLLIKVMKLLRVPKAIDLSDNANDAEQKVLNTKILDSNNAAINHTGTVAEKMVHIEAALNYYWSDENWTEPAYNNLSAIINAHHAEISLIDDYNVSATIDMLYTDTDYKKVKQLLLKDNQHLFLHLLSPQSYIQAYGSQTFPLLDTSKTHVNDNVELVIDRDDEVAYYVKNIKDKPNPDVNSQYIESVLTLYNTFTNSEHETFFNSIPEVNPNAKNAREITYHDFSNATNTQYPYPDYYVGDNQEYAQGFTVMNEEIAFFSKDAFTPAATKSTIRDTTTADGPHQPIFTADGNGVYIASSGEPLSLVAYEKGSPEALAASKAEQGFALSSEVIAKAVTAAAALAAVADLASRSAHDNPLATMLTSYEEKTKTTLDLIIQLGVLYEKYVSPPSSNKETFNKNKTSLKDV